MAIAEVEVKSFLTILRGGGKGKINSEGSL